MKNKVLKSVLPVLCVAFTVAGAASCKDNTEHVHTYSSEWSKDATGHWYDMTCDCEDVPVKAGHVDKNNDKACDICEYTDHTHTYQADDDWTVDCENHWHAPTCGCIVAGTDKAAHVDENEDGKCDTCSYVIKDIHVHVFDDEWTSDETDHWHAALCEHKDEVDGKEAHVLNAAGDCTVCGAHVQDVDVADIEAVLAAAAAKNYMVVSGNVDYVNVIPDINVTQTHSVYYVLGNGNAYVNRYQYEVASEAWYQLIGEDEVFGVITYDAGITFEPVSAGLDHLNGYSYNPSTIVADVSTLDGVLSALYEFTKADTVKDVVANYNVDTGIYSFSYEYLSVNKIKGSSSLEDAGNDESSAEAVENVETRLFKVEAAFTIDENFVINWAEFEVGAYNQDIDGDYTYDVENGTYTMSEGALADTYHYVVAQASGKRVYTTAYPKKSLVPYDFDLAYENGELVEDEITVNVGTNVSLLLKNLKPFSSKATFIDGDDFQFSVVNKDDPEATTFDPYYNSFGSAIGMYPNAAGEYTLTITYGNIVKEYALHVKPAAPTSISVHPFYQNSGWGATWMEVDASVKATYVELGVGETYDFAVKVNPNAANQDYTYTISSEDATITDVTIYEVMAFYENFESYVAKQFKSNVAGTYTVTFTATEDENVKLEFIFYVGVSAEPVTGATFNFVTPGNFAKTDTQTFTATEAGTYVITAEGLDSTTWLQYYQASDDTWAKIQEKLPFSIELEKDATLELRLYGWSSDMAVVGTPVTVTVSLSASEDETTTWEESLAGTYENAIGDYSIMFFQNSDTSVYYMNVWGEGFDLYYTYEVTENADGTLTINPTFVSDYWANSGTEDVDGIADKTFIATPNGDSWTFSIEGEEVGGGEDETPTEPDGTETNPYVITGETTIMISATTDSAIFVKVSAGVTVSLNCAAQFFTDPTDMSTSVGTTVTPDVDTLYYVYADTKAGATGQLVATVGETPDVGGDDEGGDVEYDYNTVIVEGANTLYFSADEIAADSAVRSCTISTPGIYSFKAGNLFVKSVKDSDGNAVTKNEDYTYTLAAGEYTVEFAMLSTFNVPADTAQELNLELKA